MNALHSLRKLLILGMGLGFELDIVPGSGYWESQKKNIV
jgi:hypothetical protein